MIVNDDLEICVEEMHQIICGEHHRSSRNMGFIQQMKEEFERFEKENNTLCYIHLDTDLMKVVNKDVEEGKTKSSQQQIFYRSCNFQTCKAADRRRCADGSREIRAKPLSIAIEELEEGQLKIMAENAEEADALQAETEEAAEAALSEAEA